MEVTTWRTKFRVTVSYTRFLKGPSSTTSRLSESTGGTLTWKLLYGKQDTHDLFAQ